MSINEIINIVNNHEGKIIKISEDAFQESVFECSAGHTLNIFNNDLINGMWCDKCQEKDKIDILFTRMNINYEKNFTLDNHIFYRAIDGSKKILITKDKSNEILEIKIANKYNYQLIFIIDESLLEEKLWPSLKSKEKVIYIQRENIKENKCQIEERLDDKTNGTSSIIKRSTENHPGNRNTAYGYIRVSTVMQVNDGFSLEAQENKVIQECEKRNFFLSALYIDKGLSGGSMDNRLALNKLRENLKSEDWIIVASVSRLARNTKELLGLVEEIEKIGAHLIIMDLNLDITQPSGKLILTLMASQAQFERELTSERVKGVLEHLKNTGNLRTKPHFGWQINPDRSPGAALHIRNEEEQAIIEKIRYIRSKHMHLKITAFTRLINDLDVPTGRSSKTWYHASLKKIMEREGIK